jgi:hypothetical protein
MIKKTSLIVLGIVIGAGIYDLAINLKISYNQDTLKVYCKKGVMFKQVHEDAEVFVKTQLECINETMKGEDNDNTNRKQNPR